MGYSPLGCKELDTVEYSQHRYYFSKLEKVLSVRIHHK